MKNKITTKKNPNKVHKSIKEHFLRTSHTDPRFNMIQTLERQRKCIGVIFSDE